MKQKIHYFPMDVWRCVSSGKIAVGAAGVCLSMLFASGNQVMSTVFDVYESVLYGMPFLMTMAFCAFPYADSFCDDFEAKYMNMALVRGNLRRYVWSKVVVIFCSSVITMILGICLYVTIMHMKLPWSSNDFTKGALSTLVEFGGFRYFLKKGCYMLYFIFTGMQMGLLSGMLSVFASYVSLYISNKLLVMSVPLIGYYLLNCYVPAIMGDKPMFNVKIIFDATYGKVCESDLLAFLYAVLVTMIAGGVLTLGIYRKIRRRLERG